MFNRQFARYLMSTALASIALIVGCTDEAGDDPTPTVTVSPMPTSGASLEPTEAPIVTATPTPGSTEATTPSPEPTETASPIAPPGGEPRGGWPEGAAGPLAVYSFQAAGSGVTRFAVRDLQSGELVAEWDAASNVERVTPMGIAGLEILMVEHLSLGDVRIVAFDLMGNELRVIGEPGFVSTIASEPLLSPDGTAVAIAGNRQGCGSPCLVLVSAEDGTVFVEATRETPGLDTLGGWFPQPIEWRDDSSGVLVAGQPNGHQFFGWATVSTSGHVRDHKLGGALVSEAPGGRRAVTYEGAVEPWEMTDLGCTLYTEISLHDLDRDSMMATFTEPGAALGELHWSPDGSALLLGWRRLPEGGACDRDFAAWRAQPADWRLVAMHDGSAEAVCDPEELQLAWYAEPRLALKCDGVEHTIGQQQLWRCNDGQAVDITLSGKVLESGFRVRLIGTATKPVDHER